MYFGKSVQELTLPEAAMLAALPRSPGNYSPFERPELAQRRRAIAIGRLLEQGYISETQAKAANRAALGLVPSERRRGSGQYFLEYLQQSLEAKYGSDVLYKSGLAIYTTLDPVLQRAAEQALRDGIQALAERQGARAAARGKAAPPPAAPEGAIVVIEAATGYVKALTGGVDFTRTEFNRALHAHRQPGSAFKPFVYLAALETGHAPTEVLDDSPIRYVSAGKVWAPENYDGKFRGPVTLQQALEESINVPTIRLLEEIGVNPVIDAARRAGIQSPLPHDLTLALGSGDVTLLELTAAYGTFANQGVRMEPLMVRYVTDAQGRLVEENIPQGREAIDPAIAIGLTDLLRGVVERGTAVGARVLERPLAGKTGTTNDFSNAWFVGYTPSIVAGVWLGHDRPRSLGPEETGARAALPIWVAVMRAALRGQPVEDFPAAPAPVNGTPAARP
jgi:penicillin-binding protein 1A